MPKRKDIKRILVVGAGPIIIGQACEFDYSGTQACKALKDEGYKVILINSNPATIMTDPDVADKTYIEPITVEVLEKILVKEKPDAILSTMGGCSRIWCLLYGGGCFHRFLEKKLIDNVKTIVKFYKKNLNKKVKIGITGLNPHCYSSYKNTEENLIIRPAIKFLRKKNPMTKKHFHQMLQKPQKHEKHDF